MTVVCLSKKASSNNGISIGEALLLLVINNKIDLEVAESNLIQKGLITADLDSEFNKIGWRLTKKGIDTIDSVIADSDKQQEPKEKLEYIATELKKIFPKGKKPGTNYYWTEGTALIIRRLKLFFKKYGNNFSDEQIINAANKYVSSFNGDYKYMKLLKYFIFKEKIGVCNEAEGESDLITYIENAGQEDELSNDWTSKLV